MGSYNLSIISQNYLNNLSKTLYNFSKTLYNQNFPIFCTKSRYSWKFFTLFLQYIFTFSKYSLWSLKKLSKLSIISQKLFIIRISLYFAQNQDILGNFTLFPYNLSSLCSLLSSLFSLLSSLFSLLSSLFSLL